jgi:hypothetical protein
MICRNVRAIVALPFEERTPYELAALERHTEECGDCLQLMKLSMELDFELRRLPEPSLPVDLTPTIMARLACSVDTEPGNTTDSTPATARVEWYAWATAAAGISMGLGVQAYSLFAGEMSLNLNSLSERMAAIPRGGPALLVFIAGSLLYLAGIFRLGRATNPSRETP